MFSMAEKGRRHKAIQQILEDEHLEALLLIGDANLGFDFLGDLRYHTNNRTITHREVVVICRGHEPVLFTTTTRKLEEIALRSFICDSRMSDDLVADVTALLQERGISSGRIGVNCEMLSMAWDRYFRQKLPEVEWVETHERIMQIRRVHSVEEADVFRKGAALGDGSFEAALKAIRPGASEFEIVADLEHHSRSRGAEEHFTLIGSAKFSFDTGTNIIFYYPTHRRLEIGDSLLMEITPRYQGYWTQLVRAVNVGKPNKDLERLQAVCRDAIRKGLEQFKPGNRVKDVVAAMISYVETTEYQLKPPFGHICGVDMIEGRVSPRSEVVLTPGTAVIIHPTVFTSNNRNWTFCGETYLVTEDGYERLHRTSDGVITV
ncbi:MAG: Xaa-Pro peptidase family protein [candidate division WOR-3 bacterium]